MTEAGEGEGEVWVRIQTAGRLHFGLLTLPHADPSSHWPDMAGQPTIPRRHFGGAGLMVQGLGWEIALRCAQEWSARGPQAERVLAEARQLSRRLDARLGGQPLLGCEIAVAAAPPAHAGLGSGTQLCLALARALLQLRGHDSLGPAALAQIADRGRRSAIGVHGFFHGGFLVDAGKHTEPGLGHLLTRVPFPDAWRIVVVVPRDQVGLHGKPELAAFGQLRHSDADLARTDAMCRLLLLGMLPALTECDLEAFGEALLDYNRRAGEMYQSVQGDVYAHPQTHAIVELLRREGIRGVGQSSWGPATFAVVSDEAAPFVVNLLRERFDLACQEIVVTSATNSNATLHEGR